MNAMVLRRWAAVLVASVLVLPVLAGTRTITPDDLVNLKQVADPQITADGARITYTVATPRGEGKLALSRIWRIGVTGDAKATELPAPAAANDSAPRWSPDGLQLLFLSDRTLSGGKKSGTGLASTQVWQVPRDGSAARALTASAGEVLSFSLSHDGRSLAYVALDPLAPEAAARAKRKDDAIEVDHPRQFARLWLRDLRDGTARTLTPERMQVHEAVWSPDGKQLALRISTGTTLNDYWYRSRVVLIDAGTGRLLRTLCDRASAAPLSWSPDGKRLIYGELGEHGMTAALFVHDLHGDKRVPLASDWPGTLWGARWQDDAQLIGEGQRGVRAEFLRIDAGDGKWTTLAQVQAPWQAFSVARNGDVAFVGMRDDTPAEIWSLTDGKARALTSTHPQVAQWSHGQLREISWRSSRDGLQIHGLLMLPPDYKPGTRLPTLVQIHGGPAWAWWSGWLGSWHEWAQLLSSHGYAVLMPNPRGSEGQGGAFTEMARSDWGGADYQDVLDGLDQIVEQGIADPKRVAIGGWSYGGYLSAWAVTQGDRFKTAIVGAGVIDIGGMALSTDTPDYLPGYFGDPVTQRDAYDKHSPIRYADKVKVPVLILHGEQDKRVPVSQGEQFYGALKFNGTPVEMVRYPRGPHWFHEREHERDVLERVLRWLDTHL
ncbi:S9 family peptidase [Pseudoxanthomonas sp. CF125]|uniref:S9 family peptidase n=1 Tax=Pseudoxanthomonas sp. CF125 TaxID=1855303 RepID=UPI000885D4F5|nr:S9 family peptidase [Pseudoxanthomonas sp. CF125]SDR14531.1 Dipeptidyl aminopeptidase/acylaminoacyl peptidase [Pseudoxanthomonas sp. CF125]